MPSPRGLGAGEWGDSAIKFPQASTAWLAHKYTLQLSLDTSSPGASFKIQVPEPNHPFSPPLGSPFEAGLSRRGSRRRPSLAAARSFKLIATQQIGDSQPTHILFLPASSNLLRSVGNVDHWFLRQWRVIQGWVRGCMMLIQIWNCSPGECLLTSLILSCRSYSTTCTRSALQIDFLSSAVWNQ